MTASCHLWPASMARPMKSANRQDAACSVDLRVPAGTTLALVGESGSGKSSIVQLACRFYDPDQGAVRPCLCQHMTKLCCWTAALCPPSHPPRMLATILGTIRLLYGAQQSSRLRCCWTGATCARCRCPGTARAWAWSARSRPCSAPPSRATSLGSQTRATPLLWQPRRPPMHTASSCSCR